MALIKLTKGDHVVLCETGKNDTDIARLKKAGYKEGKSGSAPAESAPESEPAPAAKAEGPVKTK